MLQVAVYGEVTTGRKWEWRVEYQENADGSFRFVSFELQGPQHFFVPAKLINDQLPKHVIEAIIQMARKGKAATK